MLKAHNAVPAIKDKKIQKFVDLSAMPAIAGGSALLFCDPAYDYEVVGISALVTVVTTAVASPFALGASAYQNIAGTIVAVDLSRFLTTALCLDSAGASFSTGILALGSRHNFIAPGAPGGTGNPILYAGAALTLTGTNTANTGELLVTVTVRPKDKDRGDHSKRPGGASDAGYLS
jgi:hypothetical protein